MFNWYKQSLARKITSIVSLCFLFTFAGIIFFTYLYQQRQIMNMELNLAQRIDKIIIDSFKGLIVNNRHDMIKELINTFGKLGLIERIHIIDENGLIKKSNQPERLMTKSVALNLDAVLKEGKEVMGKEYKEKENLWLYSLITPIKNEESCFRCHGTEKKVLGALRLGFYLEAFKKPAIILTEINIFIILIGLMITYILLRVFLRLIVIRPIEKLLKATKLIAEGNLNHRVAISSGDEIGRLSVNFNILAKKLKLTLDEAIQSTKMNTLGLLSAAVFHDLIGSVSGIRNYAQFILETSKECKPEYCADLTKFQTQITNIEKEAVLCQRIIENYYSFSGEAPKRIGEVDIKKTIEGALSILENRFRSFNIETKLDIPKDLPLLLGNSNQLLQAFINIILNSYEAMPGGGKLEISARVVGKDSERAIIITFSDTGCGIPQGDFKKVTEPFFTSKQEKGNIGLGLTIVKQVIDSHRGKMEIESQIGKGTKVTVELPA